MKSTCDNIIKGTQAHKSNETYEKEKTKGSSIMRKEAGIRSFSMFNLYTIDFMMLQYYQEEILQA